MKIEIDYNQEEYLEFTAEIPDCAYRVIAEHWEDGAEWAEIEITEHRWQTWIAMRHPDWIIDATQ